MTDFEPAAASGRSGSSAVDPRRTPGKSSLTQNMPRGGAPATAAAASTSAGPAAAPARDPAVEQDLAAAVGFFDGPGSSIDSRSAPANSNTTPGKTAAPVGGKSKPASKGQGKGKKPAPPVAPAPAKATHPTLTGQHVYLHSDTTGIAENDDAEVFLAAGTWVLVLDERWHTVEEPRKSGTVKVDALYDAVVETATSSGADSYPVRIDGKAVTIPDEHTLASVAAHDRDRAAGGTAALVAELNREFKPLLASFDGGFTSESVARLFAPLQQEALWFFLETKLIPAGLFTEMPAGAVSVPQRIQLAAHILTFGQYPKNGERRKAQADFCYHWVQLVWNYAGVNEGQGGNAGTRGVVGPIEDVNFGAGKQVLVDEFGNPMGQLPPDPSLSHHAAAAGNEAQTTRRGSVPKDYLSTRIKPGDWLWVYNGNASAGGGHSVVFVGWLDEGKPVEAPAFKPRPAPTDGWSEEHDGPREKIEFAKAQVYSQTNNSPKSNAERGGKAHTLSIGPYYYRQFRSVEKPTKKKDAEGKPIVESKEQEQNEIVPVYCITRSDPSSHTAGTAEELVQYPRSAAIAANLELIKAQGLPLWPLRDQLGALVEELLLDEKLAKLSPKQRELAEQMARAEVISIDHLSDLVALSQRLDLPEENDKHLVDGLLAHAGMNLKALAQGAPKLGAPLDLEAIRTVALEANRFYLQKRNVTAAGMRKLVESKLAALGSGKAAATGAAETETLTALGDASRGAASDLEATGYTVAQWQQRSGKPLTGWLQDMHGQFTSAELARAKPEVNYSSE